MHNKKRFIMPMILLVCLILLVMSGCYVRYVPEHEEITGGTLSFVKTNESGIYTALTGEKTMMSDLAEKEIWVTVEVEGSSIAEEFLLQSDYGSIRDFISSEEGAALIYERQVLQNEVIDLIKNRDIGIEFKQSYTTLLNGFSAKIKAGDLAILRAMPYVTEVTVSEFYSMPESTITDLAAMIQGTGILANETEYKGENTVIAVLDTGLDYNHTAFRTYPENAALTKEHVLNVFENLYINTDLGVSADMIDALYHNAKVPFGYDYADKDTDVQPGFMAVNFYSGYHGTHVAGIAAGDDDVIQGSAPKAQIVPLKVFGDSTGGAYTTDVLAALCDAVALGVDVINMSLGSGAGVPEELGEGVEQLNGIYELVNAVGINLCVSTGNDGNSSIYANNGNGNLTADPDNGVVGSPASYSASFGVASCYGGVNNYFTAGGNNILFRPAVDMNSEAFPFLDVLLGEELSKTFEFVIVPGIGSEADYEGLDVAGKIAVVTRGETSFEEKQNVAASKGAVACVILNNETGIINAQMENCSIPTCTVTVEDAEIIRSIETTQMTFAVSYTYIEMSEFSSIGPLPDLQIGVDITAPGGDIYSAMPSMFMEADGYAYLSGTSMAAPNVAGVAASVRQYIKEKYPEYTSRQIQSLVWRLLMSTATPLFEADGTPITPRQQGSGLVNIEAAVTTNGYLEVTGTDRVKLELGHDKNRDGKYILSFKVVNTGEAVLEYEIDTDVFTESAENGYIIQKAYVFGDSDIQVSVKNGTYVDGILRVEAGSKASVTVTVTLSDAAKAYMDETFENGIYVEGFVYLDSLNDVDLSIPWLAYYGDWGDPDVLDGSVFDEESIKLIGNQLLGQFVSWEGNFGMIYQYLLGGYTLFVLPEGYEAPESSPEKIALSHDNLLDTFVVSALRAIKNLSITIEDPYTGVVYYQVVGEGLRKTFVDDGGGTSILQAQQQIPIADYSFYNNQTLVIKYAVQGYAENAEWETMEFPLFIDYEAPTLENAEIREENGRTILYMDVFDNHYLMNFSLLTYDDSGVYSNVYNYAIPVYNFAKNQTNTVSFDLTDFLPLINGTNFAVEFLDYAMNSVVYNIDLSTTSGDTNGTNTVLLKNDSEAYGKDQVYSFNSHIEKGEEKAGFYSDGEEFVIDENGVLIAYNGNGGEVIIPDGVVAIGEKVFAANRDITRVVFPEGLTMIGFEAFKFATSLTEAVFPSTLETIEESAFVACYKLAKADISNTNISYVGWDAFCYSGLEEVIIPDNGNEIQLAYGAFSCLTKLKRLTIYADIESLNGNFSGCDFLEELNIYGYIGNFSEWEFSGNKMLRKIEFHNDVGTIGSEMIMDFGLSDSYGPMVDATATLASMEKLEEVIFHGDVEYIGGHAFSNCPNLYRVVFEGSVGGIGPVAFQNNEKLKSFDISADNTNFIKDEETGMLYNTDYTKMYKPGNWDYDGIFVLPETITSLEIGALSHFSSAIKGFSMAINMQPDSASYSVNVLTGTLTDIKLPLLKGVVLHEGITEIPGWLVSDHTNLDYVEIKGDVTTIGHKAFFNTGFTEFVFPETVVEMGAGVLASCKNLERVVFPEGLQSMGENGSPYYDFLDCVSLKEITLPDCVTGDMYGAFKGCISLETVYLPEGVIGYGRSIFEGCTSLKNIYNKGTAKSVGLYAFTNCASLESIKLDEGLKTIGNYAFDGCVSLKECDLPSTLTSIGTSAFRNCTSLEEVNIPAGVIDIDLGNVYENCSGVKAYNFLGDNPLYTSYDGVVFSTDMTTLVIYPGGKEDESFTIPAETMYIADNAFRSSKYIKDVYATTITEVGTKAFSGSSIEVFESVYTTFYSDFAFDGAIYLRQVDLSCAEYIGDSAFRGTALTSVTLGAPAEYIGTSAFAECPYLENVTITDDCCLFDFVTVFFNTNVVSLTIGKNNAYLVMDEYGSVFSRDNTILYKYVPHGETDIVIPEGIKVIAANAFKNNTEVVSITLPSTLEVIGANAFLGAENLSKLTFLSEIAPVLQGVYEEGLRYPYNNFVRNITEGPLDIAVYAPNHISYQNLIWRMYFAKIELI